MSQNSKGLLLVVAMAFGLWGCARVAPGQVQSERIKALEAKVAKMEEDVKSAIEARDHYRNQLAAVEEERVQMTKKLQQAARERDQAVQERDRLVQEQAQLVRELDELRQTVASRTRERDGLLQQYETFRTEIRALLGQADAAAAPFSTGQPVTAASGPSPPPS
jgi:chromosome segregation ATPase